ncbi:Hypothetical protein DPCES_2271, partial [Desulfitobacterium hafniense]
MISEEEKAKRLEELKSVVLDFYRENKRPPGKNNLHTKYYRYARYAYCSWNDLLIDLGLPTRRRSAQQQSEITSRQCIKCLEILPATQEHFYNNHINICRSCLKGEVAAHNRLKLKRLNRYKQNKYVLGIIWSLGSYTKREGRPYFRLRHNEDYFLRVVKDVLPVPGEITFSEKQYSLFIPRFRVSELLSLGWQPRNSEQRDYPKINEHRDFIRAYIEIHSAIDTII